MKLYRGDSLPHSVARSDRRSRGRTFADHFCGNGLMAKFAGRSELLAGKDLTQLVIEHVGYVPGSASAELAYHSPMLSFTSSLERAFAFCERHEQKRLRLTSCLFEEATHFVWELDTGLAPPEDAGLNSLVYEADPVNCRDIVEARVSRGLAEEAATGRIETLATAVRDLLAQEHAAADKTQHRALLIDVIRYLDQRRLAGDLKARDQRLVANCYERARRDSEWLLYPADPMPDGYGLSSRFAMNRHLRVFGWFRLAS